MRARTRKLIGVFGLVAFILVYALMAMVIGATVVPDAPEWARAAYYITAGLLWALPAMALVRWMQRPD